MHIKRLEKVRLKGIRSNHPLTKSSPYQIVLGLFISSSVSGQIVLIPYQIVRIGFRRQSYIYMVRRLRKSTLQRLRST